VITQRYGYRRLTPYDDASRLLCTGQRADGGKTPIGPSRLRWRFLSAFGHRGSRCGNYRGRFRMDLVIPRHGPAAAAALKSAD